VSDTARERLAVLFGEAGAEALDRAAIAHGFGQVPDEIKASLLDGLRATIAKFDGAWVEKIAALDDADIKHIFEVGIGRDFLVAVGVATS
jgi:hypothetical protein